MLQGSCLCRQVQFEVSEVVGPFELCHCSRCRKVSGSAFIAGIYAKRAGLRFLKGTDLIKTFDAPILEKPPPIEVASAGRAVRRCLIQTVILLWLRSRLAA